MIDEVEDVLDHLGRGVRVERYGGGAAGSPDLAQGPVRVRARLDVDDDDTGLAVGSLGHLNVLVEHGIQASLAHHELGLEGQACVAAAPLDGVRSEGQVWYEVTVHDIELDTVAACILKRLAVGSKLSEVGGKDGRNDLDLARLSVEVEASVNASGRVDGLKRQSRLL